jgi:hypothetical protein
MVARADKSLFGIRADKHSVPLIAPMPTLLPFFFGESISSTVKFNIAFLVHFTAPS